MSSRRVVVLAFGAIAIAAAVACGADAASAGFDSNYGDGGASPPGTGFADSGEPPGSAVIASSGVVVVHAALYPAFRLCFGNFMSRVPFPDSTVMPDSNVVGVEIGSVVRSDPLEAPGDVYVIDESIVQSHGGGTTVGAKTCADLICTGAAGCLREDRDYSRAGTIAQPIGKNNVDILAITGCGNTFSLEDVDAGSGPCGSTWNNLKGNLVAKVISLEAKSRPFPSTLPVQLLHMSQTMEAARGQNVVDVTFGAIGSGSAPLGASVSNDPQVFTVATGAPLPLAANDDAVFAAQGFRVAIRDRDAGPEAGASFYVDTSLAEVQTLSAPRDLPAPYYQAASNYVLLLLGDPAVPPRTPSFDPRRGVHLLAVPVIAPSDADAGQEAGNL